MIIDILDIIEKVKSKTVGDIKIRWSSDTFNCEWSIQWSNEELKVSSESENVVGNVDKVLTD
ncbi:MAG: hypothetical protein N4A50_05170 [Vallitalea sp.]|jgi:hypothetical protein|nr:hypothetical protein [Vallitalea sp.]